MEVEGGKENKAVVMLYEATGAAFLIIGINWSSAFGAV